MTADTKTIDQFLAENPDVDVSKQWERCWNILTDIKTKIAASYTDNGSNTELVLDPSCEGREYYTSPAGEFEGSFKAWSGGDCDWLVNSWIGNRKASILDMNATCFTGQDTDVPHFIMVFGTVPKLFFYFDFTPRRDIRFDADYLAKYYQPINEEYLALRGHPNFQWAVSHGTYMRALINPSSQSLMGDLTDENISIFEDYAYKMLGHWLGWQKNATKIETDDPTRIAQQEYDFKIRELGYRLDPMNKLSEGVFGKEMIETMVDIRMGKDRMEKTKMF